MVLFPRSSSRGSRLRRQDAEANREPGPKGELRMQRVIHLDLDVGSLKITLDSGLTSSAVENRRNDGQKTERTLKRP
jgi:hypothetical protein